MKQTLQLRVAGQLALTPQLQQSIKLLQLSTVEMNEEIERLLLENPMLEGNDPIDDGHTVDAPDINAVPYDTNGHDTQENHQADDQDHADSSDNYADSVKDWMSTVSVSKGATSKDDDGDDIGFESFVAAQETLAEHLMRQLAQTRVSEKDRQLITLLIESLDDDGFLEISLEEIYEVLPFELDITLEELNAALALLQHFDPAGVGARSPAECLRLQIDIDEDDPVTLLAANLVDSHLDKLAARDYLRLRKSLKCKEDELKEAIDLILSLNPRPGAQYAAISTRYIIPDTIVRKVKGQWIVSLNEEAIPKLKINKLYASILQSGSINRKDTESLHSQLQEARWFIKNIQQRFETILRVSTAIMERQEDFLEHGDISMRPLVLKEIADILELHESTISRVTTQKYIQTPRGIYELKYFFGSHCGTDSGGACSSTAIRALIRQMIEEENSKKPLSDSKIAELLGKEGIQVARRTVAKYRELLQIPPVSQRKTI